MTFPRGWGWIGLVAVLGPFWLVVEGPPSAGSRAEAIEQPQQSPDTTVRITHELVQADVVRELIRKPPRTSTRPPVATTPTLRRAASPAGPRPGVTRRAMRMLIGDGRYRPAPFPTVTRPPKP